MEKTRNTASITNVIDELKPGFFLTDVGQGI